MIIDDSKLDRFTSTAVIENNHFAEEVLNFDYATAALAHLRSLAHTPDALPQVIFLDINMPVMDGFGFLENYERLPASVRNSCTVIMISSTNSPEDFAKIKTFSSVRKFFNKPLSADILSDIRTNVMFTIAS